MTSPQRVIGSLLIALSFSTVIGSLTLPASAQTKNPSSFGVKSHVTEFGKAVIRGLPYPTTVIYELRKTCTGTCHRSTFAPARPTSPKFPQSKIPGY